MYKKTKHDSFYIGTKMGLFSFKSDKQPYRDSVLNRLSANPYFDGLIQLLKSPGGYSFVRLNDEISRGNRLSCSESDWSFYFGPHHKGTHEYQMRFYLEPNI